MQQLKMEKSEKIYKIALGELSLKRYIFP